MAKDGFRVMDSDIHVNEPPDLWERYMEPAFKDRAPRPRGPQDHPAVRWVFEGKTFPAFMDRPERQRNQDIRNRKAKERHIKDGRYADPKDDLPGHDPRAMLKAMDTEGIDISIVFRTNASHVIGIDGLDEQLAAATCRAFNNWLADFCATDRERLKPAILLPVHDVELSVQEARRGVRELGGVALIVPNHQVNWRPWYDPYYEPLWAEAERLGVPIAFHGIQNAYQTHLAQRYMDNFALAHSAAHPVELMLAMGSMLTGGVFARHPGLRGAFLEGHCSWVPWWLWCLDEHVEKFGDDERFGLTAPPSEYFRRQCYVSADAAESLVTLALKAIGDSNIVISTDWPHDDSPYPHAIDTFLGHEEVPAESKRKILWDNCARLYGLA